MTNPNISATIDTVPFEALKPGDKFLLRETEYVADVGVCVRPPVLSYQPHPALFWKKAKYKAVCIQLHQYLGACEWNAELEAGTMVELLQK